MGTTGQAARGVRRRTAAVAFAALVALALAACGGGPSTTNTLTIDASFDIQGLDPARSVTPAQTVATRGIYDTLLRAKGGSDTTPAPSVAESFEASADARTYTFHLRRDVTFPSGRRLTSADVVFSFRRLAALKMGSSYLMDGITASAPDETTVVLASKEPNPAIPFAVTTPAFALLDSQLVTQNGGTDADDAATSDRTESWFNHNSAGSGPYRLESYKTNDSIILTRNDRYWGRKPEFARVAIRAMKAPAQLLNVQRGTNEVALNLSATQSRTLENSQALTVRTDASPSLVRMQTTMNAGVSATAANPHIREAVRYGVNYDALVQLAGAGAVRAAGLLPAPNAGSLPPELAVGRDVERARAAVRASGIDRPSLTLTYPSDINVNGVEFATLAQRIKADLRPVGIEITLAALPTTTYLSTWRKGTIEMTLTYSYPDTADPSTLVTYLPGGVDGVRAGWKDGDAAGLEEQGRQLSTTVDDGRRAALAAQMQRTIMESGPYMPILQAAQTVVGSANLTGVVLDPGWTIDVTGIGVR
ncbi:ABC transporter substrate-binding protein [Pseudonocardia acaciae]|uniref:ABC transporter substrate-binding protein n=1 Tax=Pseudonocardia acaciae TaxID=551276 RepID=UPI00048EDE21|nr:ABC transporter substrate-binding protein [Pseudonocardia acaciae]